LALANRREREALKQPLSVKNRLNGPPAQPDPEVHRLKGEKLTERKQKPKPFTHFNTD